MKRILALVVVVALGAGGVQAKTAYCKDQTTHKRISCKTVTAPAAASTPMKPVAATQPTEPAYKPAPTKKPSMFSGMMKPKPATAPMQSPAPATRTATSTASMASGGRKTPNCVKGKLCGMSCIKATDVCHKPG
jgi:hypothetical protein